MALKSRLISVMAKSKKNKLLSHFFLLLLSVPVFAADEAPLILWPEDREKMLNYASMFEGAPYSFGARKPSSEDCSSFVRKVFSSMGIELPRSSRDQASDQRFVEVSKEEMRPGDLVFFRNTYRRGVSHVGLIVDSGQMIHASPRGKQVARDNFGPRHALWRKIHSVKRWRHSVESEDIRPRFSWDDKI